MLIYSLPLPTFDPTASRLESQIRLVNRLGLAVGLMVEARAETLAFLLATTSYFYRNHPQQVPVA
jgi:hypothetical protein